ncbi:uncharacterized protein FMAN_09928 [Fusarium mangiferae]|uniref:CCHC-type domain-containing protein n=1 Tax=Fusarium mangiferae TaxID=192010 RepID=A0A1L7TYP2_FUSMA|nr:uncharacterized protein FMAN_09928 [Fusarium mangiferae]CVL00507.1 uncharacterized protein FMAN_09928 [Fusarium mangiferae]
MSDIPAPEKQAHQQRASGSGRGNIGPHRSQDTTNNTARLSERYGVEKSQRDYHIGDRNRERCPKPNRAAEARSKKIAYEILMSENNARPRRPVLSRPLAERTTKAGIFKPCANCKGQGHQLADCITTVHGYIKACIFCDNDSHRTDECESFKRLSLAEKVKLLVTDRAGKPALALWWTPLYEFLEAKETQDIPLPTGFPWTAKFAIEVFQGKRGKPVKTFQTEFDATQDPKALPVDMTVRSLPDVWSYYWFHEGRRFPLRAHIPRP